MKFPPGYREIFRDGFDEYRRFVNHLIANRTALAQEPVQMRRIKEGCLVDVEGREYEDFHGTQAFGHRPAKVIEAIRTFLDSDAPNWYPSRVNPFCGRLARQLCERTGYEQVWFGCSGSEVVDAAIKLTRAATGRARILSLRGAYHGCNMGSTALMTPGVFKDPFAPHIPACEIIEFNDIVSLELAFRKGDPIAAVFVEPIQGEGGVRKLSEPFVNALCSLCHQHRTLLVADEIQTSLGRTGQLLYSSQWPHLPDVVLIAKALGGGLIPVSAMLTRGGVFGRAYGRHFESGEWHNQTFSYNALSAVAGLTVLEMLDEACLQRIDDLGRQFRRQLREALSSSPLYREVRGAGLMVGVRFKDFSNPWLKFEHFGFPGLEQRPAVGPLLASRLYRRGFYCFVCGHDWHVLRLQPRFNIPSNTLINFVSACQEELNRLSELDG